MVGYKKEPTLGLLFSDTGVTADIEKSQRYGAQTAIKHINDKGGINGHELLSVHTDLGGDPNRFRSYTEELIKKENINIFIGCYMSHTRKAVMPAIEKSDSLLFYPTPYEGFEYSPNFFYGGPAPNQNSAPLAAYLIKNHGPRIVFVGSDYIYPRESNHVMRLLYKQYGGDLLDEFYLPLYPSFDEIKFTAERIKNLEPDVVFSTIVGHGTSLFYEEFHNIYQGEKKPTIASLTTSEAEINNMPNSVSVGNIVVAPYFSSVKSKESSLFLSECKENFPENVAVTAWSEAAYHQVMLLSEAMKVANSWNTACIRKHIYNIKYKAPQGLVWLEKSNNHTNLTSRIAQIDKNGKFDIRWTSNQPICPDPYVVVHKLEDWTDTIIKAN
ncbi:MAG: transporter substrate-binding domain-containing protein [Firmicutes bacterium]|nr:transporter substrate-binding domain-containing protein [Bacillota bacterium]